MAETQKAPALTDTPEFKKAVAEAAALAAAATIEQIRSELAIKAVTTGPDNEAGSLMERLAMHIAELTDQGTQRKRVAPEILAQRAAAEREAIDLIIQYRKDGVKPEYALVSTVYLNERLIQPFQQGADRQPVRTQIIYTGMPSDAMRPINGSAKTLYELYRRSVGSVEKLKSIDNAGLWMTGNGLVVKTPPTAAQRSYTALPVMADPDFSENVQVTTQDDPTAPFVQVLGTVAQPARQTYTNQAAAR